MKACIQIFTFCGKSTDATPVNNLAKTTDMEKINRYQAKSLAEYSCIPNHPKFATDQSAMTTP